MSWFDRRAALVFLAGGVAGCGFRPLYGRDGQAGGVLSGVSLQEAATPEDFAYRERLRRRLDLAGGETPPRWRLSWALDFETEGVAITRQADITRYRLTAAARYTLAPLDGGGAEPIHGEVSTTGAYDASASAYATRAAEMSERRQLSAELAELTATRLLTAHLRPAP